jgi:hypothetical protein
LLQRLPHAACSFLYAAFLPLPLALPDDLRLVAAFFFGSSVFSFNSSSSSTSSTLVFLGVGFLGVAFGFLAEDFFGSSSLVKSMC